MTSKYLEQMKKSGVPDEDIPVLDWEDYNTLVAKIKDEPEIPTIPTAYSGLTELNGGFEPGRLYVLGAPPKQGKTAFVMSMMYEQAKMGVQSLIFSYEVGWKNVVKTFMAMEKFDGKEVGTMKIPMYIPIELHREGGQLQLQWLREAIEKAKKSGVEIVVIDYLHFLIPYQVTQNFSIVVAGVVREIKRIAVDCDMPIVLIVAMKKIEGNTPTLWDIRDSSMIMHEADDIMIMYRLTESMLKNKYKQNLDDAKEEGKYTKGDKTRVDDPFTKYSVLSLEMSRKAGNSGGITLFHNGAYFKEIDKEQVRTHYELRKQNEEVPKF